MKKEEQLQKVYNTLLNYQKQLHQTSMEKIAELKQNPGAINNVMATFDIKLTMVSTHSMLALLEYILDDTASIERIQNIADEIKNLFISEN